MSPAHGPPHSCSELPLTMCPPVQHAPAPDQQCQAHCSSSLRHGRDLARSEGLKAY